MDPVMEASTFSNQFWTPSLYPLGNGDPAPPVRIKTVSMSLLTDTEINKRSVCEITSGSLYDRALPRSGGLNDVRLGSVDRKIICGTCHNNMLSCSGHTGHIEFAAPVFHPSYVSDLVKLFRSICSSCFRLTADPVVDLTLTRLIELHADEPRQRFAAISQHLKTKRNCAHADCGAELAVYHQQGVCIRHVPPRSEEDQQRDGRKRKRTLVEERVVVSKMKLFSPADGRHLLLMIDHSVLRTLGFSPDEHHPVNCILQTLLVPPPMMRPSIMFSESSKMRGQDDLTHKLQEIVKQNNKLKKAIAEDRTPQKTGPSTTAALELLQVLVASYMHQEAPGAKTYISKGLRLSEKDIVKRFKGKRGRFRGNLMGKRVNFSARTVISPDATMDIGEIGIPREMAHRLTFEETVTGFNLARMQHRVDIGTRTVDGARSVVKCNGKRTGLGEEAPLGIPLRVQIGWKVERYMQDGDIILLNRQPSLRKKSIMSHRVRLVQGKTVRLNVCCTSPYNADFDGDEMNIHLLQDVDAAVEAEQLMSVETQILNAQNNRPCIGIVQDALVGSFLMTSPEVLLTRAEASQLVMNALYAEEEMCLPVPAIVRCPGLDGPRWTGSQIWSFALPPVSLGRLTSLRLETSGKDSVVIRQGELLSGQLCKKTIGAVSNGVVHVTCLTRNSTEAAHFLSDCQRITNAWMESQGFSIGLRDCVTSPECSLKIQRAIKRCSDHIDHLNQAGDLQNVPMDKREGRISRFLSEMLGITGNIVQKHVRANNALVSMVSCQSKGNLINISQISGCVGQQSIEGHRIFHSMSSDVRTMSCFPVGARSIASRGFIESSYVKGLSPAEFFFHMMSGREGIVDTSVKTADTGYLQRRITKSLESIQVRQDGTVRDASGRIYELRYGGDNRDASRIRRCSLRFLNKTREEMRVRFGTSWSNEFQRAQGVLFEAVRVRWTLVAGQSVSTDPVAYLPFCVRDTLERHSRTRGGPNGKDDKVTPDAIPVAVDRLMQLPRDCGEQQGRTLFLRSTIVFWIRSAFVIEELGMYQNAFEAALCEMESMYRRSRVDPGEMVGALASESIGEPSTQLTLNTFHFAGVAEKNITLGVPRLKELIDGRRNNDTPSMGVYLDPLIASDEQATRFLARTLIETRLMDVTRDTLVLFAPDCDLSRHEQYDCLDEDAFLIRTWSCAGTPGDLINPSSYVIRILLKQKELRACGKTITDVRDAIYRSFPGRHMYNLLASEPGAPNWILRIRMCHGTPLAPAVDKNLARMFAKHLGSSVHLYGIENIEHASVHESCIVRVDPETWEATVGTEWYIHASGVNLVGLWETPGVDWKRTCCNNVPVTCELLGIEAASALLFQEIKNVLSFDGGYIDARHIMMVVNVMTHSGSILPLNRHGFKKMEPAPLVKCTFEETADTIFDNSLFGDKRPVCAISDSIMLGQTIPGGTGSVCLRMEPEYLSRLTRRRDASGDSKQRWRRRDIVRTLYSETAHDSPLLGCPRPSPSFFDTALRRQSTCLSPIYIPCSNDGGDHEGGGDGGGIRSPVYIPSSPPQENAWKSESDLFLGAQDAYDAASLTYAPSQRSPWQLEGDQTSDEPSSLSYRPSSPSIHNLLVAYRPSSPVDMNKRLRASGFQSIDETIDSLIPSLIGNMHPSRSSIFDRRSGHINFGRVNNLIDQFK